MTKDQQKLFFLLLLLIQRKKEHVRLPRSFLVQSRLRICSVEKNVDDEEETFSFSLSLSLSLVNLAPSALSTKRRFFQLHFLLSQTQNTHTRIHTAAADVKALCAAAKSRVSLDTLFQYIYIFIYPYIYISSPTYIQREKQQRSQHQQYLAWTR